MIKIRKNRDQDLDLDRYQKLKSQKIKRYKNLSRGIGHQKRTDHLQVKMQAVRREMILEVK
jgi:hypothetical protein